MTFGVEPQLKVIEALYGGKKPVPQKSPVGYPLRKSPGMNFQDLVNQLFEDKNAQQDEKSGRKTEYGQKSGRKATD